MWQRVLTLATSRLRQVHSALDQLGSSDLYDAQHLSCCSQWQVPALRSCVQQPGWCCQHSTTSLRPLGAAACMTEGSNIYMGLAI